MRSVDLSSEQWEEIRKTLLSNQPVPAPKPIIPLKKTKRVFCISCKKLIGYHHYIAYRKIKCVVCYKTDQLIR